MRLAALALMVGLLVMVQTEQQIQEMVVLAVAVGRVEQVDQAL
jgi:hypothetical protein